MKKLGLRELIRDAADLSEIDSLNHEAARYHSASKKTRRRWVGTADRRIAELQKVARAK